MPPGLPPGPRSGRAGPAGRRSAATAPRPDPHDDGLKSLPGTTECSDILNVRRVLCHWCVVTYVSKKSYSDELREMAAPLHDSGDHAPFGRLLFPRRRLPRRPPVKRPGSPRPWQAPQIDPLCPRLAWPRSRAFSGELPSSEGLDTCSAPGISYRHVVPPAHPLQRPARLAGPALVDPGTSCPGR